MKKKQKPSLLRVITILLLGLLGLAALAVVLIAAGLLIADRTNGSLRVDGETRRYLLYVPSTYDPARPTPLVISMHGFAEWPAHQAHISRWNELAEEEVFIVVHPSGTRFPKRWRASALVDTYGDPQADVAFITALIDKIEVTYNIDPARVYANGLSNGGGMSLVLACTLSERIAAIGGVAGAYVYPMQDCNPARPVPLIAFHGDSDPVVPYLGGPSDSFDVPFPSIPEWMAAWAQRNECAQINTMPRLGDVSGLQYRECRQNADVDFYTIAGGGHTWPGGNPLPVWITGPTTQDIDATRLMWWFFLSHPLPAEE